MLDSSATELSAPMEAPRGALGGRARGGRLAGRAAPAVGRHAALAARAALAGATSWPSWAARRRLDCDDEELGDRQLEGLANGALVLEKRTPPCGAELRRTGAVEMRGRDFVGGHHDLVIRRGGVAVFPRVVPELSDEALGGGLKPGTTRLVVGQSGTGKSTLATTCAQAAAGGGRRAAVLPFKERPEVLRRRSADLGFRIGELEDGRLSLHHFDPAEVSRGRFTQAVVSAVEDEGARVVVIGSLSGHLDAPPEGRNLVTRLHASLSHLSRRDAPAILITTRPGLLSGEEHAAVDASYLADGAILPRRQEDGADPRRTIAVPKKHHVDHERAVREFRIGGGVGRGGRGLRARPAREPPAGHRPGGSDGAWSNPRPARRRPRGRESGRGPRPRARALRPRRPRAGRARARAGGGRAVVVSPAEIAATAGQGFGAPVLTEEARAALATGLRGRGPRLGCRPRPGLGTAGSAPSTSSRKPAGRSRSPASRSCARAKASIRVPKAFRKACRSGVRRAVRRAMLWTPAGVSRTRWSSSAGRKRR